MSPPGLPAGLERLDPESALYAPPVVVIDGVQHRWWLADVEEEALKHPSTFFIPSLGRRRSLEPGDSARLVFRFSPRAGHDPSAERMWVAVAGADERGYAGYLANQPYLIKSLEAGDVIGFDRRHVAATEVGEDELGFDPEARAFVSARVADGRSWPGYLVLDPEEERQPPQTAADGFEVVDSGWQVLAGDESEDELGDARAAFLGELGWLVERFPQLLPLIRRGEVGEWIWNGSTYDRAA
jgi:hypothetical protein